MCTCLSVHLLFGMSWVSVHIHVIVYLMYGVDLVIYLIRKGFVGGFGGREKSFLFQKCKIEKY